MSKINEQLESKLTTFANRSRPSLVREDVEGEMAGRSRDIEACILTIDRIIPDPEQVRQTNKGPDDPETKQLADSIHEIGLQQALKVRYDRERDRYVIIAGERRYHAAKLADLKELPCKIANVDPKTVAKIQLHENVHRKDLSALEIGAYLCGFLDDGMTYAELIDLTKKGKPWVSRHVNSFKKLTKPARDLALQHRLGVDHLYHVARLEQPQQLPLLKKVVANGLSVTQIRQLTDDKVKVSAGTGGRSKKSRPYTRAINTGAATVTVRFKRQRASLDDVVTALRDALERTVELQDKATQKAA